MTNKTPTLSRFLLETDTQIRFFDIGRRVSKIILSDFVKFEQCETPYPFPYEQTAWVGVLFWNKKDKKQHNIWFIRMPLDETGFIQLSARDEFMHMLLSRFSEHMQNPDKTQAMKHVLKDNPYVYKPTEDKLAIFHSKALLILQQPPTQYYADALNYLEAGKYQQWEQLGIQGITDIAVRQNDSNVRKNLLKALPSMPDPAFNAFCQSLENEIIDTALAKTIATRISTTNNEQLIANGIRALANCQSSTFKNDIIFSTLENSDSNHIMPLVAISAKAWEALSEEKILQLFLDKLAINKAADNLFNSLVTDLMFIPGMREKTMNAFRNPKRSEALSNAVGQFFQSIKNEI